MPVDTPTPVAEPAAEAQAGDRTTALRAGGRLERFFENRLTWMIISMILGVVMIFWAAQLNIGGVRFDGVLENGRNVLALSGGGANTAPYKEVGYFWALNWSVFGCLLAPFIIFTGMGVPMSMRATLAEICERGMVRDEAFRKVPIEEIEPLFEAHLKMCWLVLGLVFVLVMGFMLSDWWGVVGKPIIDPDHVTALLSDPKMEYDWSVSSLYKHHSVSRWGLFAFGLIGYILLAGLVPAFAFAVLLSAAYFVGFLTMFDKAKKKYRLAAVPSRDLGDPHFGFKCFEAVFTSLLLTSLLVMVALWLMLLQNTYLRDVSSTNILQFVLGDAREARRIASLDKSLPEIANWILAPADQVFSNIQVVMAVVFTPMAFALSLGLCWLMLRGAARKARAFSKDHMALLEAELALEPKSLSPKLRDMKIWPVGWISSWQLLAIMVFMVGSLISYRLAIIPVVVTAGNMLVLALGPEIGTRIKWLKSRFQPPADDW